MGLILSGCKALKGCDRKHQCARYHRFIHSTPYEGFNAYQTCRVSKFVKNDYPHFVPVVHEGEIEIMPMPDLKRSEKREGLSADCTLNPAIVLTIVMGGKEHPCDRCNMDRSICRGYPRLQEKSNVKEQCLNDWPLGEEPYPPL